MLTIFTIPKPFKAHIGVIQRNAIRSWTLLEPACEVVLFGDEPGTGEAAAEFGVRHVPEISRNDFGTPLLDSVFESVASTARFPIVCYVNADIVFFHDLLAAVRRIPSERFLAVGRRTNLAVTEPLDFEAVSWRSRLLERAALSGERGGVHWIDYFVFPLATGLAEILPFAVGRPEWDNWFLFNARRTGVPIVDISRVCTAVHQNHDFAHVPQGVGNTWYGPEADRNHELAVQSMKVSGHLCNIWDATHILGRRRLFPAFFLRNLHQRWYTASVLHPALRPIVRALDPILRPRRWIREHLQGGSGNGQG